MGVSRRKREDIEKQGKEKRDDCREEIVVFSEFSPRRFTGAVDMNFRKKK